MPKIIWTQYAKNDFLELVDYIADKNQNAAESFIDSIEKMNENMSKFPEMGIGIDKPISLRQTLVHPARILYFKKKDIIYIIACVHQSMDWETLLIKRKIREI